MVREIWNSKQQQKFVHSSNLYTHFRWCLVLIRTAKFLLTRWKSVWRGTLMEYIWWWKCVCVWNYCWKRCHHLLPPECQEQCSRLMVSLTCFFSNYLGMFDWLARQDGATFTTKQLGSMFCNAGFLCHARLRWTTGCYQRTGTYCTWQGCHGVHKLNILEPTWRRGCYCKRWSPSLVADGGIWWDMGAWFSLMVEETKIADDIMKKLETESSKDQSFSSWHDASVDVQIWQKCWWCLGP